jgi:glycosyltransferase involved in cell wall biosynthesis
MISVVLATHNEAENLPRCLEAVKEWADEIVIADGESTDETVNIAQKYHAKIIKTTNKANFHINKQLAMDAATKDLVLQLDADEVVDGELREFIVDLDRQLSYKKQPAPLTEPVAWWIKRKNFFMQTWLKKGGQYPDPVIRLYLRNRAHLPQKDVHEQMIVDGPVATAKGHLLHYATPNFETYLRKFNTYTSFKATQLFEAKIPLNFINHIKYLVWLWLKTFVLLFFRHKGFVDGFPGFVFAFASGMHHPIAYLKLWEKHEKAKLKKHD